VTPNEEQDRAAVAQQAGTWFIANQSGSLEQAERAAFMAWLKASPIHVEEYLGVALVAYDLPAAAEDQQESLASLLELARADDAERVVPIETSLPMRGAAPRRMRTPYAWSFAASIAAMVLLLAAPVVWWARDGEFLRLPKTYRTAHGEQVTATLPDGSELRLNTDSEVTVRYSRRERVVELARGQALLTVARDKTRRFRVAADELHVIAVGTRFESYRRRDATSVTVVEGSVAVLAGRPPQPEATGLPADALRLEAGYQVQVDSGGLLAQPVPVDLEQALAWLQLKIAFDRRPLGEVADEFNRYGTIPIEINDAALRTLQISGVFGAYEVDSFVAFLQTLDGVRVERTPARIRVFRVKTPEG